MKSEGATSTTVFPFRVSVARMLPGALGSCSFATPADTAKVCVFAPEVSVSVAAAVLNTTAQR